MRKPFFVLIITMMFMISGCGLKTDEIYTIDDNLNPNTFSDYVKILNINRVTDGWVKGFLPNQKNIIAAKSNDTSYILSSVNIDKPADSKEIFKSDSPIIPYIEVSPVDKKIIAGDSLIDLNVNKTTKLKIRPDVSPDYQSYSFLTGKVPVNVDFEYLYGYDYESIFQIKNYLGSGMATSEKQNFDRLFTWFFINKDDSWYMNFKPISMQNLFLPAGKYFFISSYGNSSYTYGSSLWCYDLRTRILTKIDDNVKVYDVSSDLNLISYVTTKDGNDNLMTFNYNDQSSSTNKNLIATFPDISGLKFSPSGKWISFSAGEKQKNDIYLASAYDNKLIEQLTHGYNSTGSMYWSEDSSRIAFNSFKNEGLQQNPDIYYIEIAIKKDKNIQPVSPKTTPYADDGEQFNPDVFYNSLLYVTWFVNNY